MTNREWLNNMDDDEFADWLCEQMFPNYGVYGKTHLLDMTRFHTVRNFLKMKHTEGKEDE